MNNTIEYYENYPISDVIIGNILNLLTFTIGAVILAGFSKWIGIAYFAFCIIIIVWVLKVKCANCYYYGKVCCIGLGKVAAWFFKKGDEKRFYKSANYALPITALPVLGAVVLLIIKFDWLTIGLLAFFILLILVRTFFPKIFPDKVACVHCKQRDNCSMNLTKQG